MRRQGKPEADVVSISGDTVHLECTFDNLQADEPVINGAAMTSAPLRWGEKTTDEMCLNYLYFTFTNPLGPEGVKARRADGVGGAYATFSRTMEISPLRERLTKLESRLEILRGHL